MVQHNFRQKTCIECDRPRQASLSRGFTLIELLIVLVIIALLLALLFPVLKSARDRSLRASCLNNLHQIGIAMAAYTADWETPFVPDFSISNGIKSKRWAGLLLPYLRSREVFICPANPDPVFSYGYNLWLGRYDLLIEEGKTPPPHFDPFARPGEMIAAFDAPNGNSRVWGFLGEWDTSGEGIKQDYVRRFADGDLVEDYSLKLYSRSLGLPIHDWLRPRHDGANNLLFLDGHARWIKRVTPEMGLGES